MPHQRPSPAALAARLLSALLLLALLAALPARAGMPEARDPADLIAGQWMADMSLEQKAGQVIMIAFEGATLPPLAQELIARRHVGGICLFSRVGNTQDPTQVAKLAAAARRLASPSDKGPGLFVAVDQEGGTVVRLTTDCVVMPPAMLLAASGDPGNARRAARITAQELLAVGINMNLAPVLDVNVNPGNRAIGTRSYGADPEAVARFGLAAAAGIEDAGVLPVAKHFPGHGDTDVDSHWDLPLVSHSRELLESADLLPFRRAVAAGIPAVMTAHLAVPALDPSGLPATLSPAMLGLLRGMGFDGLIVSDSLGMAALARRMAPPEAALAAFKAGCDILLFGADRDFDPRNQERALLRLLAAVRAGEVSQERLDASVRRILRAKAAYGIKGSRGANPAKAASACGTPEHLAAARDLAASGITLVKPAPGLFPFPAGARVLVLWPGGRADLLDRFAGVDPGLAVRILDPDPTEAQIAATVREAAGMDAVVLLAFRPDRRPNQVALARALQSDRLVVASMAEPQDLAQFPEAAGLVAAYGGNPCVLEALARALYGRAPMPGSLPVPVPGYAWKPQANQGS